MRFKWILPRLATIPVILLLATGCSGFQGSHSVSPASFLLPGLMKADPPQAPPTDTLQESVPAAGPVTLAAQSH